MNDLVGKIKEYQESIQGFNKSLSSYITVIIELVEADAGKEIIIEHLRNIQKITHNFSEGKKNGQNS